MKCIVCEKQICDEDEICKECDDVLNIIYRTEPKEKELSLDIFRRYARGKIK